MHDLFTKPVTIPEADLNEFKKEEIMQKRPHVKKYFV